MCWRCNCLSVSVVFSVLESSGCADVSSRASMTAISGWATWVSVHAQQGGCDKSLWDLHQVFNERTGVLLGRCCGKNRDGPFTICGNVFFWRVSLSVGPYAAPGENSRPVPLEKQNRGGIRKGSWKTSRSIMCLRVDKCWRDTEPRLSVTEEWPKLILLETFKKTNAKTLSVL